MNINKKKSIIAALLFPICLSCSTKSDHQHEVVINNDSTKLKVVNAPIDDYGTLDVNEFADLFKEKEQTEYTIKSLELRKEYVSQNTGFWNTKKLTFNDSLKKIGIAGYPLSFRTLWNGVKRITTIAEYENQSMILVFMLDSHFNTVSQSKLASYGGDEGVVTEMTGTFANDSVYQYIERLLQYDDNGNCDSTSSIVNGCLIFSKRGLIEQVENCSLIR